MDSNRRFTARPNLKQTLIRRERSASWLARKVGVSPQLMSFVLNNHRTLAEDKAMRAAAVLDEPVDFLFAVMSTDVSISGIDVCKEQAA